MSPRLHRRQSAWFLQLLSVSVLLAGCSGGGGGSGTSASDGPGDGDSNPEDVEPPTTVVDLADGTVADVAASEDRVWLAQGRNLALLEVGPGQAPTRVANHNAQPYPAPLVAVEYEESVDTLYVATEHNVYVDDLGAGTQRGWTTAPQLRDLKAWPGLDVLVAVAGTTVFVLDTSGAQLALLSTFAAPTSGPDGILHFVRVHLAEIDGRLFAFASGQLASSTVRGQHLLLIVNLDSTGGFANPSLASSWDPLVAFGLDNGTTVHSVAVTSDGTGDHAYVAAGRLGQLAKLDVSDPTNPVFDPVLDKIDLHPGFEVLNLRLDPSDPTRMYVATTNTMRVFDLATDTELGSRNTGFGDGGDRDMAFALTSAAQRLVWTGTHAAVRFVVNGIDVTPDTPEVEHRVWWVSSSDGGVAVPAWSSVYLPTFAGVGRYDVSDLANPVATADYEPANGTVEHLDIAWPQPGDPDHALLLGATGSGGAHIWPVSATEPQPGPVTTVAELPPGWVTQTVYNNDVGSFHLEGHLYVLSELANKLTDEVALQIYDLTTDTWITVIETSPDLRANGHSIEVWRDYAFVTCEGGFFVVSLAQLPALATITDQVVVDVGNGPEDPNGIAVREDGEVIFLANDLPGALFSYGFDPATGLSTGRIGFLDGEAFSGNTDRARLHHATERLYVPSRGGRLLEVDVADPSAMELLTMWSNGSYGGDMQDTRVYDFGDGPRLLVVKNNETFAILDPDDGL